MSIFHQIAPKITSHMQQCDGPRILFSTWYVGISADPERRLFTDHNVSRSGAWVYQSCGSEDMARELEAYFLSLGCKGGSGGGFNPTFLYAYKIASYTKE